MENMRTEMLNDEVIVEVIENANIEDVEETIVTRVLNKLNFKVVALVGGGIAIIYIGKKKHIAGKLWGWTKKKLGGVKNIFKKDKQKEETSEELSTFKPDVEVKEEI